MSKEFSVSQVIKQTESDDPLERIKARIALLRNFPKNGDQDLKKGIYFKLSYDVQENREKSETYVSSLKEPEDIAYAALALNFGLGVDRREKSSQTAEKQRMLRQRFVNSLGELVRKFEKEKTGIPPSYIPKLDRIKNLQARLEVAEIVSRESNDEMCAESAVDQTGEIGWNTRVPKALYSSYGSDIYDCQTIAESLLETSKTAKFPSVRQRALRKVAEVPDPEKRKQYLELAMTFEDKEIASKAFDFYTKEIDEIEYPRQRRQVILDALKSTYKIGEKVYDRANPVFAEKAFVMALALTPKNERLGFVSEELGIRNASITLKEKCERWLGEHIEDIVELSDLTRKQRLLWRIAQRNKGDISLMAVDYIAKTSTEEKPLEGVETIASVYVNERGQPTEVTKRVGMWAMRFVRKFADLEDEKLARKALGKIAGYPDPTEDGKWCWGDGRRFELDQETGMGYEAIARYELQRLKAPLTEKQKLAQIFSSD